MAMLNNQTVTDASGDVWDITTPGFAEDKKSVYLLHCSWPDPGKMRFPLGQREIQDPKMEVLYHIGPYFVGIFPHIGLTYGRYLQFRFLKWPLTWENNTSRSFTISWSCWRVVVIFLVGNPLGNRWRDFWALLMWCPPSRSSSINSIYRKSKPLDNLYTCKPT